MTDPRAARATSNGWSRLEHLCFLVIVLLVGMRPLISETYDSAQDMVSQAVSDPAGLTPATTVWIDLGLWLCFVGTALAAWRSGHGWRLTGVELGAGFLVLGAIISTWVTGNKRLALNASADWLTALVVLATLANLCRTRRRQVLLLAVLAASGLASLGRCVVQITLDHGDTVAHYESVKEQLWKTQNIPLDDPRVILYERRLRAREASGFLAYSNVQGTWLGQAAFAGLAVAACVPTLGRRRLLKLLAALLIGGILLTGSKGAILAVLAGLLFYRLMSGLLARWPDRWRKGWLIGWIGVLSTVAVALWWFGQGSGPPGDSLRFRWNYWEVTQQIIRENLLTGVGAMNFDRAYVAHKPVQFPEEIKDPHNFVLAVAAQWGLAGAVGLLIALGLGSWYAVCCWGEGPKPDDAPAAAPETQGTRGATARAPQTAAVGGAAINDLPWLVGGFVLLRLIMLRGWLDDPGGGGYVFFDLIVYGSIWVAALWLMLRWAGSSEAASGSDRRLWAACAGGVAATLLHGLIDFGLSYPATHTGFAALAALLVCCGRPQVKRAWAVLAVGAAGTVALLILVTVPVTSANGLMARARSGQVAERLYAEAAAADPHDPTPLVEGLQGLVTEWLGAQRDVLPRERLLAMMNEAINRDPRSGDLYRFKAALLEAFYRESGSMSDVLAAVGAGRRAVELYPASPDRHEWFAELLVRVDATGELLPEAVSNLQEAVSLDADRALQEIRRWSPEKRAAVDQRLAELQRKLIAAEAPASEPESAPATTSSTGESAPATQPG